MKGRGWRWLLLPVILVVAAAGLWIWLAMTVRPPVGPDRLVLEPVSFADLPGWRDDRLAEAVPALQRSCGVLTRGATDRDLGIAGRSGDWREACAAAAAVPPGDETAARHLFESHFLPFGARNGGRADGLFTGYFEISLRGSRRPGGRYVVPLYASPPDLVSVDLGLFRDQLKGQRIAGRVVKGALRPYEDRAAIDGGALHGRGLELVWVDDPVDAFFLHIQGSGQVELDDGSVMRVGYAAQNGHPYVAIGRHLIERGALTRQTVSMQSIRAWLAAHPDEAARVMALNPSYVFFRELIGAGPVGAQGVALTPGRSLAVDRRFVPLGVPVWLDAMRPQADPTAPDVPLRRLMVAQDTGGAIRGPVRGDVFWGAGSAAAEIAGRMKHDGRWFLLLPRPAAARLAPSG